MFCFLLVVVRINHGQKLRRPSLLVLWPLRCLLRTVVMQAVSGSIRTSMLLLIKIWAGGCASP
ncbi:hypothetical protein CCHR01_01536 [Colletotrichum chrysophilum]|uniref:Uncharacterized protein n=1 Tax=Colletotrichum chrysophilum TaxID=1836956 RepID=A0AAD9AWE1_9PEZI|nr:hypothetical protein CCHR01_01536 [Colletotrichum chrysophilum]